MFLYRFRYHSILIGIIFCASFFAANAQEEDDDYFDDNYLRYENFTYIDSIETAIISKKDWLLSYPIIHLNGADAIHLRFDDLRLDVKDYSYTIIHCNSDWKPSGIMETDYIDGLMDDQIVNYKFSFNTFQNYVHYDVIIPNENMKIKLPGNYILFVFEDFDREKPVLTRRFCVVENKVEIEATAKCATDVSRRDGHHEIDFTVSHGMLSLADPFSEIKIVITQNNRWDNAIYNLKPIYLKDKLLVYDYEEGNVFKAGSEYLHFDIKSVRYQSDRISQIVYKKPHYHVQLFPDEDRTFKLYFFNQDLNGKYMPEIQEGENNDIDADYVYVYFTLPYPEPMVTGNIYVFGGLSDWNFTNKNRMIYNYESKCYQLRMFLKQGYYNYKYIFLEDGKTVSDESLIEGSHYETENDYIIYVYHRDISERFDRLVGTKIVNTLRSDR